MYVPQTLNQGTKIFPSKTPWITERLMQWRDKIMARAGGEAPSHADHHHHHHHNLPYHEVGPTGRLIPIGDEEDPGDILHRLKELKLVSDDIEH